MSAKFRVLRTKINFDAAKTRKVVKATCVLHNFLLARKSYVTSTNVVADSPITSLLNIALEPTENNRAKESANDIRNRFAQYFTSDVGKLSFQNDRI